TGPPRGLAGPRDRRHDRRGDGGNRHVHHPGGALPAGDWPRARRPDPGARPLLHGVDDCAGDRAVAGRCLAHWLRLGLAAGPGAGADRHAGRYDAAPTHRCSDVSQGVLRGPAAARHLPRGRAVGVEWGMQYPKKVRLVEVGPRDGLQNEAKPVSVEAKVKLIDALSAAGHSAVESGSFVSPKWVPQMANTERVMAEIKRKPGVSYPVLVPNKQGMNGAVEAHCGEIAIFTAASEAFCRKNTNCSIDESFERFAPVLEAAQKHGMKVRGYVSTVIACPYDGKVAPKKVAEVSERLFRMGCYEVSLGDTIGVGTPAECVAMVEAVAAKVPREKLAAHFHDTYGQSLANIMAVMERGIAVFDTAVAGLGGCPYAKGASGNVGTEDVIYLLTGLGVAHGVDLDAVAAAGRAICAELGREPASKVAQALKAKAA